MNLFLFTLSLFLATNKGSLVTANNNIRKNKSAGRLVDRTVEENPIPSKGLFTGEQEAMMCTNNCMMWYDGCNTCKCSGDSTNEVEWCTKKVCPEPGEAYCLDNGLQDDRDDDCITWYDGCNTCTEMGCTEMFCPKPGEAYCLDNNELQDYRDDDCITWYDGCNTCTEMGCTEMFCPEPGEAYCLDNNELQDYHDDDCITWYDGCNTCTERGCTEMFCPEPGEAYCLDFINPHDSQDNKCVKYGDIVHFQMSDITNMWLTVNDPVEQGSIISTNPFNQQQVYAYEWTISSVYGNDEINEIDPRAGECVQYQDKVYIQVNNADNLWLTGGRGMKNRKVAIRDHIGSETESNQQLAYRWTIRSNTTNGDTKGNDSRTGDNVRYDGDIFLQIDNVDNR